EVIAAYDAPFPDDSYKEDARRFPLLVPTSPEDPAAAANRRAWETLRVDGAVPHRLQRFGPRHPRAYQKSCIRPGSETGARPKTRRTVIYSGTVSREQVTCGQVTSNASRPFDFLPNS